MSNIAGLNRTKALETPDLSRWVRLFSAQILFVCLLVSFSPFALDAKGVAASGGNIVNQLGYSALAALSLLMMVLFTDPKVVLSLFRPVWLLLFGALFLSVHASDWPDAALRAFLFSVMVMVAAVGAMCLPASIRDFRLALATGALAVLGLSYFGILLMPSIAIHQAVPPEPQHAGLWHGIFSHKNVAGAAVAMLFFAGLYIWRSGQRGLGLVIAILAALFVYKTGSKTTLVLMPCVVLMVIGGRGFGGSILPALSVFAAFSTMTLMTLGTVLFKPLDTLLQTILPGTTFTGRTDLWRFTLELLRPREWRGFGIESFWLTPHVTKAEQPFELSWDMREIVNAHNGYLELVVWGGWPLLAIGILVLVLAPLWDYVRTPQDRENVLLADFCLMVLSFGLLNAFLESFFLSRGNQIWLMMWMAIVGLHLARRFRIT